eukprot:GHVP01022169.1.p1 GENE.GHVP01022169.1~~GHVP01022169.1.p1  ORF type:complete len:720 (-),score=117.45 GHVP01022169.1:62-2221(-)
MRGLLFILSALAFDYSSEPAWNLDAADGQESPRSQGLHVFNSMSGGEQVDVRAKYVPADAGRAGSRFSGTIRVKAGLNDAEIQTMACWQLPRLNRVALSWWMRRGFNPTVQRTTDNRYRVCDAVSTRYHEIESPTETVYYTSNEECIPSMYLYMHQESKNEESYIYVNETMRTSAIRAMTKFFGKYNWKNAFQEIAAFPPPRRVRSSRHEKINVTPPTHCYTHWKMPVNQYTLQIELPSRTTSKIANMDVRTFEATCAMSQYNVRKEEKELMKRWLRLQEIDTEDLRINYVKCTTNTATLHISNNAIPYSTLLWNMDLIYEEDNLVLKIADRIPEYKVNQIMVEPLVGASYVQQISRLYPQIPWEVHGHVIASVSGRKLELYVFKSQFTKEHFTPYLLEKRFPYVGYGKRLYSWVTSGKLSDVEMQRDGAYVNNENITPESVMERKLDIVYQLDFGMRYEGKEPLGYYKSEMVGNRYIRRGPDNRIKGFKTVEELADKSMEYIPLKFIDNRFPYDMQRTEIFRGLCTSDSNLELILRRYLRNELAIKGDFKFSLIELIKNRRCVIEIVDGPPFPNDEEIPEKEEGEEEEKDEELEVADLWKEKGAEFKDVTFDKEFEPKMLYSRQSERPSHLKRFSRPTEEAGQTTKRFTRPKFHFPKKEGISSLQETPKETPFLSIAPTSAAPIEKKHPVWIGGRLGRIPFPVLPEKRLSIGTSSWGI